MSLYKIASLIKEAATMAELEKQRSKGRGKILGSAATMAVLPGIVGAQVASYDVGLKKLHTKAGLKAIARHGKGSFKTTAKYIAPLTGAAALFNEARYHIRKRNAE